MRLFKIYWSSMTYFCRLHLVSTQQNIDERILNFGKVCVFASSNGKKHWISQKTSLQLSLFLVLVARITCKNLETFPLFLPSLNVFRPFRWHWWKMVRRASLMAERWGWSLCQHIFSPHYYLSNKLSKWKLFYALCKDNQIFVQLQGEWWASTFVNS